MSSPLGWRSAGNSFTNRALSEGHPAWTAALIDESIQVSNTSVSPFKSLDPHLGHFSRGGGSLLGSDGRWFSSATSVSPHFLQYHTGIGVPKTRCLDTTQSQSKDWVQSIRRFLENGGTHRSWSAEAVTSSVICLVFMNHWGREMISTGVLQRQHVLMFCFTGSSRRILAPFFSSSTTFLLASSILSPLKRGSEVSIRPFSVISLITGRPCFFCHLTSNLSPNVHTITAPVPNVGSTSSSAMTGIFCPKTGTMVDVPTRFEIGRASCRERV